MSSGEEKILDLGKIWAIIWKNWLVLKRDKARLAPLMMFPLIMILIYGSTAGVATKNLPVALVDYDHSPESAQLLQLIYATQTFTVGQVLSGEQEGKRLLDEGKIKALFVIPPEFGKKASQAGQAVFSVITDESDPASSQIIKGTAASLASRLTQEFSAQRLAKVQAEISGARSALSKASVAAQQATATNSIGGADSTATSESKSSYAYRQVSSAAASMNSGLEGKKTSLQNSIGNVIEPNSILGGYALGPFAYVNPLLALIDKQQTSLASVAFYSSLQGIFAQMQRNAADIYSHAALLQSNAKASTAQVESASSLISSADESLSAAQKDSNAISSAEISASFVSPYGSGRRGLDFLLPNILALIIFQGAAAGLGRAIAGERSNGSLTRVFLTPTSNATIITGTQLFYLLLEAVRSGLMILFAVVIFGVAVNGSVLDLLVVLGLYSVGATGVGMILSVMAKSQEQYMALSLLVILPTIFLSGVFFPIQSLPSGMQAFASILPMAYAASAFGAIMVKGFGLAQILPQLAYLAAFGALTVGVSLMLFKREMA